MRQVITKVYKFNELSEQAKDKAIENYRAKSYEDTFYFDEIIESVKAVSNLFNLKFGREYTDIKTDHIEENILNLSGVRLMKYLVNNYYNDLYKPAYIKTIYRHISCRQFICKRKEGINGPYTSLYSKMKKDNYCALTGICYDDDILYPIYNFIEKPDKNKNFEDLIGEIESAIKKTFDDTEEWINSDEFIIDTIKANNFEFTEDGKIY